MIKSTLQTKKWLMKWNAVKLSNKYQTTDKRLYSPKQTAITTLDK